MMINVQENDDFVFVSLVVSYRKQNVDFINTWCLIFWFVTGDEKKICAEWNFAKEMWEKWWRTDTSPVLPHTTLDSLLWPFNFFFFVLTVD